MNSKISSFVSALIFLAGSLSQAEDKIGPLPEPLPKIPVQNPQIDYQIDLKTEPYFIHIPASYDGTKPFGLIVFIPAAGSMKALPKGWEKVLNDRQLLFICPPRAINSCENNHRMGLAVIGALKMQELYKVDSQRVYAAGISGGARTASVLGFYQSDIFRATIQSCGSDFPREVPRVVAVPLERDKGGTYGVCGATPEEIKNSREKVKFVIITGPGDFRHGNLLDIYTDGFVKDGYKAKLLDFPKMKHEICDTDALTQALDFIEPKH